MRTDTFAQGESISFYETRFSMGPAHQKRRSHEAPTNDKVDGQDRVSPSMERNAGPSGQWVHNLAVGGWGFFTCSLLVYNPWTDKEDDKYEHQWSWFPSWKCRVELTEEKDQPDKRRQSHCFPDVVKFAMGGGDASLEVVEKPNDKIGDHNCDPQPHWTFSDVGDVAEGAHQNGHDSMHQEALYTTPDWSTDLKVIILLARA